MVALKAGFTPNAVALFPALTQQHCIIVPLTETTLKLLHDALPGVRLLQTHGLSELGILRSKSRSSDSLCIKIGG